MTAFSDCDGRDYQANYPGGGGPLGPLLPRELAL